MKALWRAVEAVAYWAMERLDDVANLLDDIAQCAHSRSCDHCGASPQVVDTNNNHVIY